MTLPLAHASVTRTAAVRAGVRVELVTIAWMIIEAVVAIAAGVLARSVLLTAFGFDSIIELISGGVLLWRLVLDARGHATERVETAERRAAWITAILLGVLCVYVVATSVAGVATQTHPEGSIAGLLVAAAAVVIMPLLVRSKRRIAGEIGSAALRADAACSVTCAYMAAALLLGVLATTILGWWWADYPAAMMLLVWLVPETREAFEKARTGEAHCGCC